MARFAARPPSSSWTADNARDNRLHDYHIGFRAILVNRGSVIRLLVRGHGNPLARMLASRKMALEFAYEQGPFCRPVELSAETPIHVVVDYAGKHDSRRTEVFGPKGGIRHRGYLYDLGREPSGGGILIMPHRDGPSAGGVTTVRSC